MNYASTGAAQQHAAMANAVRAMGAIVKLKPEEFRKILARADHPVVVMSVFQFFGTHYRYLTAYKGLVFFTKSSVQLELPSGAEIIYADKIWIPS